MLIMPAVFLGGLVIVIGVFVLGYSLTYAFIDWTLKLRHRQSQKTVIEDPHQTQTEELTDNDKTIIAAVGGGVAEAFLFWGFISLPPESHTSLWIVLVWIGLVGGPLSFIIFSSEPNLFRKVARKRGTSGNSSPPPMPGAVDAWIIVDCVHCGQKLRIPRRQNALIITCPTCRASFRYGDQKGNWRQRSGLVIQNLLEKLRSRWSAKKPTG